MSASLLVGTTFRAFDPSTGEPLSFGKVYTYQSGTSIPKKTWTSATKDSENTNPVVLSAAGWADIYLDGTYKIEVYDKNGVLINTADPISASYLSPWVNRRGAKYESDDQISVDGNVAHDYPKYRRLKIADNNQGTIYASVKNNVLSGNRTLITLTDMTQPITAGVSAVWVSVLTLNAMPSGIPQQLKDFIHKTWNKLESFRQSVKNSVDRAHSFATQADQYADQAHSYAQQAQDYAQSAAAAVASSGAIYDNKTTGISSTNNFEYFWVQEENPNTLVLYQHKPGNTADKVLELISASDLDSINADINNLQTTISELRAADSRQTGAIEALAWPIDENADNIQALRGSNSRQTGAIEALAWPISENAASIRELRKESTSLAQIMGFINANVESRESAFILLALATGEIAHLENKLDYTNRQIIHMATILGAPDPNQGKAINNFTIGF